MDWVYWISMVVLQSVLIISVSSRKYAELTIKDLRRQISIIDAKGKEIFMEYEWQQDNFDPEANDAEEQQISMQQLHWELLQLCEQRDSLKDAISGWQIKQAAPLKELMYNPNRG